MAHRGDLAHRIPRACSTTHEVPACDTQPYRPGTRHRRADRRRQDGCSEAIQGATTFVAKAQNVPDMTDIQDTLRTLRGDAEAAKEETSRRLEALKKEVRSTNTIAEKINALGEETKGAAKEAVGVGKVGVAIIREVKNAGIQNNKGTTASYAAAVASGTLASSIYNPQSTQSTSTQSQREIIVNIRDSVTIEHLRAINPRKLESHVDRAIEQSVNKQIKHIKVMSANQLKSGDLTIRAASIDETQTQEPW